MTEENGPTSGAQRQDKRQWAQNGTQEVPTECQEVFCNDAGDRTREHTTQSGCGVFFL